MNVQIVVEVIELFFQCLGRVVDAHTVVLHMDASRVHLHISVMKACTAAGVYIMYIPASTTAWLQPLDVCVFGQYKRWVAQELERLRLSQRVGRLSQAEIMHVYSKGIGVVMEAKSWVRAFELTGLRGQEGLSRDLIWRLQWDASQTVPSSLHSLSDLQAVWPRGSHIPLEELFELVLRRSRPLQLVLPQRARLPPRPPVPP